jgi:thiol-disulfide isomerase/thioredoxin
MRLSKEDRSKGKYREVIPDTKAVDIRGPEFGKECDPGHAGSEKRGSGVRVFYGSGLPNLEDDRLTATNPIMIGNMKRLFLCVCVAFCAHLAHSQSEPIVMVDNIAVTHEQKGWRVIDASTMPIRFELIKGDLILRIDGKNAAETGPMMMASLFNEGDRRDINLFVERGGLRIETKLREIGRGDYDPVGTNPFRHVASGFSAPDAEFKDIDGKPLTLEQFKRRWLLIDFMATWCPPCMERLPNVLNVVDHNDLSLNLLMVALHDKTEAVRRMKQKYAITWPIAMAQIMSPLPIDFGVTTNRWTGQIPALVLIRPDGGVVLIEMGCGDASRVEKTIGGLISSKADEAAPK